MNIWKVDSRKIEVTELRGVDDKTVWRMRKIVYKWQSNRLPKNRDIVEKGFCHGVGKAAPSWFQWQLNELRERATALTQGL